MKDYSQYNRESDFIFVWMQLLNWHGYIALI